MTTVTVTQPRLRAVKGINNIEVTPVAGPTITLELGIKGPAGPAGDAQIADGPHGEIIVSNQGDTWALDIIGLQTAA